MAALVVASLLGLGGLSSGCAMIQFYRQPTLPNTSLSMDSRVDPEFRARWEHIQTVRVQAFQQYSSRMIPLSVANALLSFLLLVAASGAMAGRPRSHHLALQAVGANILYTVVDYVLEEPIRSAVIDAATNLPANLAGGIANAPPAVMGWWLYRAAFAAELLALSLVALALTRPIVATLYGNGDSDDDSEQEP